MPSPTETNKSVLCAHSMQLFRWRKSSWFIGVWSGRHSQTSQYSNVYKIKAFHPLVLFWFPTRMRYPRHLNIGTADSPKKVVNMLSGANCQVSQQWW